MSNPFGFNHLPQGTAAALWGLRRVLENPVLRNLGAKRSQDVVAAPPSCYARRAMRTADEFNAYYATPDPWGVARATFRDRVLRRHLTRAVRNKSVLELGCGEGHLTQAVFHKARSVIGVDISDVAIARAKALNLPNVTFEAADLLDISFEGYDVITALECIHYLSHDEQGAFLAMAAREHSGKMLFLSGPIIDYQRHFSHRRLMLEFKALGLQGRRIP